MRDSIYSDRYFCLTREELLKFYKKYRLSELTLINDFLSSIGNYYVEMTLEMEAYDEEYRRRTEDFGQPPVSFEEGYIDVLKKSINYLDEKEFRYLYGLVDTAIAVKDGTAFKRFPYSEETYIGDLEDDEIAVNYKKVQLTEEDLIKKIDKFYGIEPKKLTLKDNK